MPPCPPAGDAPVADAWTKQLGEKSSYYGTVELLQLSCTA